MDVRLWDRATGNLLRTFSGHTGQVHEVRFSPDGQTVLTGSVDGTARLWDVRSGAELRRFTLPNGDPIVDAVAFSPDGRWIAFGARTVEGQPLGLIRSDGTDLQFPVAT